MTINKKEKSEKKTMIQFILYVLGCTIFGFFTGRIVSGISNDHITLAKQEFIKATSIIAPILFVILNIGLFTVSFIFYAKAKKKIVQWDGVDENIIDAVEYQLNYPLLFSSIAMIANLALFTILIYLSEYDYYAQNKKIIIAALSVLILILGMAWTVAIQNVTVKLVKELNPEKQGSVFNIKFQKKWEESCDEGQKLIIYKSGYVAFKSVSYTCLILWVLGIISMLSFHTGILPVIFVCIIYMITTVVYMITSMGLENQH